MTRRETAFIDAYLLNGFNATAAARAAGYSDPNADGCKIRIRADVAAAIDARMSKYGMAANEVIARIAAIGRSDMTDFIDDSGTGLDLAKAKAAYGLGLIKSYSFSRKSGLKIEMYDKLGALRDLGRHHKLFTDKVEVTGKDGAALLGEMSEEDLDRRIAAAEARKADAGLPR